MPTVKKKTPKKRPPPLPNGCCGLDCSTCNLRDAAANPEKQRQFACWFREHLKIEVEPESVRCCGCRGQRAEHWSPDCWILNCCVDYHGRKFCSDCPEFPCRQLRDWAAQGPRFAAAFEWLCTRRAERLA